VTPGQKRPGKRHRWRAADKLHDAQVRAYVARRLAEGASIPTITSELKIPRKDVEQVMERSLARLDEVEENHRRSGGRPRYPHEAPREHWRPDSGIEGEILDPPDVEQFKRDAFELRKRALPWDEIARLLGRSVGACQEAVRSKLRAMEYDELADTQLARRMMLEQIDSMIAAITVPATGKDIDGKPAPVVLDAIDRMSRLLDQKAKLLGLNAPQRVDITRRIEEMAEETGYDINELRDLASSVIKSYAARSLR
jgi:hypothetical protein